MSDNGTREGGRAGWLIFAAAWLTLGGVLLAHARHYDNFLCDDALISLRYAKRLIEGKGLTYNDGERIEGYSNLLWILLNAGLGKIGFDLVAGSRALACLASFMTIGAVLITFRPGPGRGRSWLAGVAGGILIALAGPFAVWSAGALESTLVAALLAWGLCLLWGEMGKPQARRARLVAASLFFGALCLARPDGALFTAAAAGGWWASRGYTRRAFHEAALFIVFPLLCYAGQLGFRLAYYGDWIPNTARVKMSFSRVHAIQGLNVIGRGLASFMPFSALAALATAAYLGCRLMRPRALFLLILAGAWLAYAATLGDDAFPGYRHLLPLLVMLAFLIAWGVGNVVAAHGAGLGKLTIVIVLVPCFAWFSINQFRDNDNRLAKQEHWEWDGEVVGRMLKRGFGAARPLLAVDAAGAVPYWSDLQVVDMLGLNDFYLPRHPPANFKIAWTGHGLGDGNYVFSRRPDLILFAMPKGNEEAIFQSGRQMQRDPKFYELYSLARFIHFEPFTRDTLIWVRRDSPKIGIRRNADRIEVPSYLINGDRFTAARLDANDRFVIGISHEIDARLDNLSVGAGNWTIEAESDGPLSCSVLSGGRMASPGRLPLLFNADHPTTLSLGLRPAEPEATTVTLWNLRLRRGG